MTPRQADAATRTATDLFRERLDNMLNQRHALYRLADLVEWSVFDNEFGSLYCLHVPEMGCISKGKVQKRYDKSSGQTICTAQ